MQQFKNLIARIIIKLWFRNKTRNLENNEEFWSNFAKYIGRSGTSYIEILGVRFEKYHAKFEKRGEGLAQCE